MIPVFRPKMDKKEILPELEKIFDSGWIGLGPKTQEFEERFAEYIGVKYAVGVNSATAALHLACYVLGLQEGDKELLLIGGNTCMSPNISAKELAIAGSKTILPKSIDCFLSNRFVFFKPPDEFTVPNHLAPQVFRSEGSRMIVGIEFFKEDINTPLYQFGINYM